MFKKKGLNKSRSKYGNKKIFGYDSKKEYKRSQELKLLLKLGEISDLQEQVKFILQPSFKKNGKTIREIAYIADFCYIDTKTRQKIVEDSKGFKTSDYKIKAKILQYVYQDIVFIES